MDSLKNISLIIVLFVMVAAIYWEVRLHWRRKIRQPFAFRPKKYMGATVFFLNNANQVLLLLRDNKKNIPFPNCWDALGGHVDPGETPLECIVREMKEEIDYQLESPTLFMIWTIESIVFFGSERILISKRSIYRKARASSGSPGKRSAPWKTSKLLLDLSQSSWSFSVKNPLRINLPPLR